MKKKRILTLLGLAASAACLAQSDWNYIGSPSGLNFRERSYVTYTTEKVCYYIPTYDTRMVPSNDLMDDDWTIYRDEVEHDGYRTVCMPTPVYEEYKLGFTCVKTGVITISVGGLAALAGIGCFMSAPGADNPKACRTAGAALCGIGGGVACLSVPLFCWGDHMRRDANWKLQLMEQLK